MSVDVKLIMTVVAESAKPIYQRVRHVEEFPRLHGMGDLDIDVARMLFSRPAVVNVSRGAASGSGWYAHLWVVANWHGRAGRRSASARY